MKYLRNGPPWLWAPVFALLLIVAGCGSSQALEERQGPAVEVLQQDPAVRKTEVTPPAEPFAYLPFRQEDASGLKVTSDWVTAQDEEAIIGDRDHQAVDFEGVRCGKPVVAMADGWAVATYQSGVIRGAPDLEPPLIKELWKDPLSGREGYLGYAGFVIDIKFDAKTPEGKPYQAQYFHVARFEPNVGWFPPVPGEDQITTDGKRAKVWTPKGFGGADADGKRKHVRAGEIIAYMGDVGVNFGYDDAFNLDAHSVSPRDRQALPPWDPQGAGVSGGIPIEEACQLHLELFVRVDGTKKRFDALDLYEQITGWPGTPDYHNRANPAPGRFTVGDRTVFLHREGRLLFAA